MKIIKILLTFLFSALLSLFSTPVHAEVHEGSSNVSVSIHNSANTESNTSYSNNVSSNTNITINENTGDASVQVNNGEFTISGTVKSISGTTLNISGQNIQFDPGKLSSPLVGQKVTIKGSVQNDGTMNASSISIGASSNSVLGTSTSAPHPSINKPTVKPFPSISPYPSVTNLPSSPEIPKPFTLLDNLKEIFSQIFSIFKFK